MPLTLEQELEQLITDSDYRVVVVWASEGSLKLRVLYMPHLKVRGEGALSYIAHGQVAEQYFRGRRRWRKAAKWAKREIAGHRELMQAVNVI